MASDTEKQALREKWQRQSKDNRSGMYLRAEQGGLDRQQLAEE